MFVYIQSLLIMMLEILCCKIFFEAFGIKREENNCWKNYSIVIGLTVLCYFIAMIFRDYFIVKQVFSIILITFFMLLYLKLSFGKAMILSALFESLLLVMDYFALLMNIYICITKISTFLILCDLAVCLATLYVSFSLVFALMRYLQGKVFLIRFYSPTTLSSSRAEFRLPSRLACA